ncbi:MAG: hypothetical protein FIB01_11630 [Gemmatimonadetes bacterium]|nr:hypothetical protein [Gemmatimonadota bacterium]
MVLLDAAAPESGLGYEWCAAALGRERVLAAPAPGAWLSVGTASKTTLLLASPAPAALFPLGDIYGSALAGLCPPWNPPAPIRDLADAAGGPEALDAALRRWADERRPLPEALAILPAPAAALVRDALFANRFARRHCGLVPKLSSRTPGIDLWE